MSNWVEAEVVAHKRWAGRLYWPQARGLKKQRQRDPGQISVEDYW